MAGRSPYEPGEILTADGVRVLTAAADPAAGPAGERDLPGGTAPLPAALLAVAAGPVLLAAAGGLAALAVAATGAQVTRRLLRPWLPAVSARAGAGPVSVTVSWTLVEVTWTPSL